MGSWAGQCDTLSCALLDECVLSTASNKGVNNHIGTTEKGNLYQFEAHSGLPRARAREQRTNDMALRRERVTTRSDAGGKGDGGVVVDLDPLSAFALMGQRTEGGNASPGLGTGSNNSSGGATTSGPTRSELQPSPPQPTLQRPTGMGSWRAAELSIPAPSARVRSVW